MLNRLLYLINMLTLFPLLLAYLAPYISPNTFMWPLAFLGLLYPILLAINGLFLLYWAVSFKRHFWSNLFIILLGWGHLQSLGSFSSNSTEAQEESFSVMSFNVRLFNVYDWIKDENVKEDIINFINKEEPSILCLQEFYAPNELPSLNYTYQHIGLQSQKKEWRMATYSKYPILEKGTVSIKGERKNNVCIYTDILLDNDTIRVYNLHLASNWFSKADYSFIQSPSLEKEELTKGVKSIGERLKSSFSKRAEQVEVIKTHMQKSPYPIILCGDFNDTPQSYAYHQLSEGLTDAFTNSGDGLGKTYNGKFPSLRIDYILCSPELNIHSFDTKNVKLSDHYPISAAFGN